MSTLGDLDGLRSVPLAGMLLEEKCKKFLADYGPACNPALVKVLGALCAGEFGTITGFTSPTQNGWVITYSKLAKASVTYLGHSTPENNIRISCPSGAPSWYAAGLAVPHIIESTLLTDWQTEYMLEVTNRGLSNLGEANWPPFYDILRRAYRDLFLVDTSTMLCPTMSNHIRMGLASGGSIQLCNPRPDQPDTVECDMVGYGPRLQSTTGIVRNTNHTIDVSTLIPSVMGESDIIKGATSVIPDDSSKVGAFIGYQGPLLEQFVLQGNDVLLNGPTGTGKTILVTSLMAKLGFDYVMYTGTVSTTDEQLLGVNSMNGDGKILWHDGPLTRAMRMGWVLFLDEFNRMPTRVQNTLLGAMAGSKMVTLMEKDGEEVYAHEGFQVIVAENLGSGYAVMDNDDAILDRFQRILNFNYPKDQEREADIILDEYPAIDPVALKIMVAVAHETRELAVTGELRKGLSTRRLKDWVDLHIAMGGTLLDSAEFTIMHELCGLQSDHDIDEENKIRVTEMIKIKGGI